MKCFSSVNFFPCKVSSVGAPSPFTESSPTRGMGTPINTRYCGSVTDMSTEFFTSRWGSDDPARRDGRDARRSRPLVDWLPDHMPRDPIELEIFKNLYHSIAEEMGAALRRTAFSPNIKERRDYSCAVFDARGEVIAMGDHMPVHLGSMPMSVRAAIESFPLSSGDVVMLNDPFRGGTHLPDITLVAPVYVRRHPRRQSPDFYVASRAHHADVGGTYPGSMGLCREIYQEGLRIPPVRIMRSGTMERDVLALLLSNVRTPNEREGDLGAQIAACHTGAERLREVCDRYGLERAQSASRALLDYSERMMRAFLVRVPKGTYRAEDFMDSDGITDRPVKIVVAVKVEGQRGRIARGHTVTVDFTGSDPQ